MRRDVSIAKSIIWCHSSSLHILPSLCPCCFYYYYKLAVVPSTRVVTHAGKSLKTGYTAFVARSAAVVGDVRLKEGASIWYASTVRADRSTVTVGAGSSILDGVSVLTTKGPVAVGDAVTIGESLCSRFPCCYEQYPYTFFLVATSLFSRFAAPGAHLDSCVVEDGAMVGMGARILSGAVVGKDSYIDAGAVVGAGVVVGGGSLWTGNPAKELRKLTVDEMSFLRNQAGVYAELAG